MRLSFHVKMVAVAAALTLGLVAQASAVTLTPSNAAALQITPNTTYEYSQITAPGGWTDLWFKFESIYNATTISTSLALPGTGGLQGLKIFWAENSDGSNALGSVLQVTNGSGVLLALSSLSFVLPANQIVYLIASVTGQSASSSVFSLQVSSVPVPPALLLFGSGILGLGLLARRRGRKENAGSAIRA